MTTIQTTPTNVQLEGTLVSWCTITNTAKAELNISATPDTVSVDGPELACLRLYAAFTGKHCFLNKTRTRFTVVLQHAWEYPHFVKLTS